MSKGDIIYLYFAGIEIFYKVNDGKHIKLPLSIPTNQVYPAVQLKDGVKIKLQFPKDENEVEIN